MQEDQFYMQIGIDPHPLSTRLPSMEWQQIMTRNVLLKQYC